MRLVGLAGYTEPMADQSGGGDPPTPDELPFAFEEDEDAPQIDGGIGGTSC